MNEFSDTVPVRKGEELEIPRLEHFLQENLEDLPAGNLEIKQFGAGHSNLTYQLKIDNWEAVLRRPPHGPVAPKAHDMKREFQILNEVHTLYPLAPKPFLYSDDDSIVGSPFFIMERKRGIVLDTSFPPNVAPKPQLCRDISEKMVDNLIRLHEIDYKETGLVRMAKPEGFMERQVQGWITRYERAKTDDVTGIETLKKWLINSIPFSATPTIIHYDYKLNNMMFSDNLSQMVGLFDWEMTTVGDPLADVGAAMSYWIQASDSDLLKQGLGKPPVTVLEGFLTRDEFIERYAQKSGRDVSAMNFYLSFAYFKLAVICQQIYYRYKKGQTRDPRFAHFGIFINGLIQTAVASTKS